MKSTFLLIILLVVSSVCFAQDTTTDMLGLMEPPEDGLYKIKDITIKFMPPVGWKYAGMQFGSIKFMPEDDIQTMLTIQVIFNYGDEAEFIEAMKTKAMMEQDESSLVVRKIIDFAGTTALSTIASSPEMNMKTKQIKFINNGNAFLLIFGTRVKDFDKHLPAIEKSFESFEIISPAPK